MEKLKAFINAHPALAASAILLAALLAFYSNSFEADWHYDDFHHIKENINIRKITNIPDFFTDPTTFSRNPNTRMYRPLLLSTLAINYWFGFYDEVGYHVVNFALHALTTFGIFLVLLFLFRRKVPLPGLNPFLPAIFGSLLFGLHTINTETVVYISSRSAGLSTFFVIFAFYAYLRGADRAGIGSWLLLGTGAFAYGLALLSKEIAVTLPGLILLYELLLNRREGETPFSFSLLKRAALRLAPFAAVAVAYLVTRRVVLSEGSLMTQVFMTGGGAAAPTFGSQMATQFQVWVYYLRETLWPTSLSIDKPFEVSIRFFNPKTILAVLLLGSGLAWGLSFWKRHPLITLGTLWFFLTLLPESLFRLNVVLNDHRLYYPLIGLIMVLTFVAARLYVRFREEQGQRLRVFLAVLAAILLLMGLGTFKRNMVFATEENIWKDVILKDKFAVRGYNNLGIFYEQQGKLDLALRYYNKTAQLAPLFPNAYINIGNVYHKKHNYELAAKYMRRAIQLEPDSSLAWYNLGNILREDNQTDASIEAYKKSLEFNARYIEAANNVANIYFSQNRFQEAIQYYQKALDIDPTFGMSYYNLGLAYEALGDVRRSLEGYEMFLRFWDGDNRYKQLAEQKIASMRNMVTPKK